MALQACFASESVYYEVANLGRADPLGSISKVLDNVIARINPVRLKGYSEGKAAKIGVVFAEGELDHHKSYEYTDIDIFESVLKAIRKKAGTKKAVLVFDNLEHILHSKKLLKELSSFLLLVDDSNYAKYNVKILLVTTASDVRNYLSLSNKSQTISNRITEIPEVARLLITQTEAFVKKGFFDLLGYEIANIEDGITEQKLINWLNWYADRIPQFLHELCLQIAIVSEASGRLLTQKHLTMATLDWVRGSLISELSTVEANLNSKTTQIGRRNQVIYALGQCKEQDFDSTNIEKIVRKEFPSACNGVGLNVSQILSQLAESAHPLLRKVPYGAFYRFVDPKLRIVVRWKIVKDNSSEKLSLRKFDDAIQL